MLCRCLTTICDLANCQIGTDTHRDLPCKKSHFQSNNIYTSIYWKIGWFLSIFITFFWYRCGRCRNRFSTGHRYRDSRPWWHFQTWTQWGNVRFFTNKRIKCEEIVNNDTREHELHSTHQGLSIKSTGHDVEWVLQVFRESLVCKCRRERSAHFPNGWSHNCFSIARMIILSTPSVLADHFTYSSIT